MLTSKAKHSTASGQTSSTRAQIVRGSSVPKIERSTRAPGHIFSAMNSPTVPGGYASPCEGVCLLQQFDAYPRMIKRTSLNLDLDLVAHARDVLKTRTTTETIHRALEEVVRREELKKLAEWDLGELTLEDLERLRRPRFPAPG
jgi:Arc/MetJ family transcription regulator